MNAYVRPTAYDDNDEDRREITDYYRWCIKRLRVYAFDLASHIFYMGNSAELNNMLINMLREKDIQAEFAKYNDDIEKNISQYIQQKHLAL